MTKKAIPDGVTAVYVYDGRVIAHASDFKPDRPGGFTTFEAQSHRAKSELAWEVVRALASPALWENLTTYDCEQIVNKMKGKIHVLPIDSNAVSEIASHG